MKQIPGGTDFAEIYSRVIVGSGVLLFFVSLLNGFLMQVLTIPRLALSAHLVGLIGSGLLIGLGAY